MEAAKSEDTPATPITEDVKPSEKKRFFCTVPGCHKDYSRAEHLYRHQLNHNPKELFRCKFPGCDRTFVRQDLCNRHQRRHFERGQDERERASTEIKAGSVGSDDISTLVASASALRRTRSPTTGEPDPAPNIAVPAFQSQVGQTSSVSRHEQDYGHATSPEYTTAQSAARSMGHDVPKYPSQTTFHVTSTVGSIAVPPSRQSIYPVERRLTNSSVGARFDTAGAISFHDSPLSVRDEFTNWLFDDYGGLSAGTTGTAGLQAFTDAFGTQIYPDFFEDVGLDGMLPMASPETETILALSTTSTTDMAFSDSKRQEVITYIKARFFEDEMSSLSNTDDDIFSGDESLENHPLSLVSMQKYVRAYWTHFDIQLPILHRPTFMPDDTPLQLLLAVMVIGASCIGDDLNNTASQFAHFTARHLRWQIFRDPNARPPARLWIFQTLVLLEIFEKTRSTRLLHERSNVHSPTTITLMRRGTAFIGESETEISTKSTSANQWWRRWIQAEATRRVAFAVFLLDAYSAAMFGHIANMSVHEIHLSLPCDDASWSATSAVEVGRIEQSLHANSVKPPTFTESLKQILTGRPARTTPFGRTILAAGLLSVSWHMQQRDLQTSLLGLSNGTARLPQKWRDTLTKAFDFWKQDYDNSLAHMQSASLPWRKQSLQATELSVRNAATCVWHLGHMFLNVNFRDCQVVTGASNIATRPIVQADRDGAKRRVSLWVNTAGGRTAVLHALQCLRETFLGSSSDGRDYTAREDHLILRPWMLYVAGLIVFCWGLTVDGLLRPFPPQLLRSSRSSHSTSSDWDMSNELRNANYQDAKLYLSTIGAVASAQELEHIKAGRNNIVGLLRTLDFALVETRWELLHEARARLKAAVTMLEG